MADSALKIIGRWAAIALCALAAALAQAQPPHGPGAVFVRGPAGGIGSVPFRPIEASALPREGAYPRTGSIRADIARYNEERGASRPAPRPSNEHAPRPPRSPSLYRN